MMELDRNKHKQREEELIEQLEQAYATGGSKRSTTPTPDSIRLQEQEQQVRSAIYCMMSCAINFNDLVPNTGLLISYSL